MSFSRLTFNHPVNQLYWAIQPRSWTPESLNEVYCSYIYKDKNIEIKITKNCVVRIPYDFLLSNWNQLVLYGDITQAMKRRYGYIIDKVVEKKGCLCINFNMNKFSNITDPYKMRISRILLGNIIRCINRLYGKYLLNSTTKMSMRFELENYNRGNHNAHFLRFGKNQVYNVFYDYRTNQCQVKRMMSLKYLKKTLKDPGEKCFVQSCDTTHVEWYVGENQIKNCVYNNKYKTTLLSKKTIHDVQDQIRQYEFKKSLNKIKYYLERWISKELICEIVRFLIKKDIFYLFQNSNF